jgi:hypothetical protein
MNNCWLKVTWSTDKCNSSLDHRPLIVHILQQSFLVISQSLLKVFVFPFRKPLLYENSFNYSIATKCISIVNDIVENKTTKATLKLTLIFYGTYSILKQIMKIYRIELFCLNFFFIYKKMNTLRLNMQYKQQIFKHIFLLLSCLWISFKCLGQSK